MERRTAHSMQSHSEGPSEFLRPSTDHRSPISFFRDVAGRSYLIVKPNDTPTFVGPK